MCTTLDLLLLAWNENIEKLMLEFIFNLSVPQGRSQWPHSLRLRSAAVELLGLRVQILPVTWMSVSCEYFVLLGTGLYEGQIQPPGSPTSLSLCLYVCVSLSVIAEPHRRPWPFRAV